MNTQRPRVRFAPSPSGSLHVGNARTALFNWLFARRFQGSFILRIEDTDRQRVSDLYTNRLLGELKWLGLTWDEGPEVGGCFGPYFQSERLAIYEQYLHRLLKEGRVFPCYCTEEELEQERNALLAKRQPPRYLGRCRNLSPEGQDRLQAEGRRPAYRFRVGQGEVEFTDLIRGKMRFDNRALGDFIIMRSSGMPAYNFAVVIDDHLMEITHVIRGEDHLSNTAAQVLLYQALGFRPPVFAHHSLILGKDQAKLSKRHGAVSVSEFRKQGFLPEVLVNYLCLVGSSLLPEGEIVTVAQLLENFSLEKLGKSGAIFDFDKLKWLNAAYIRKEDPGRLLDRLGPFLSGEIKSLGREQGERIALALRDNLATLAEAEVYLPIFLSGDVDIAPEARAVLDEPAGRKVLSSFLTALQGAEERPDNLYQTIIARVKEETGLTGRNLFLPIRAALTGRREGPELDKLFSLLERETMIKRVEKALRF